MKIYKLNILIIIAAILYLSSCVDMMQDASDATKVQKIEVSYKINSVTGFVPLEGDAPVDDNFSVAGLNVKFINFSEGTEETGTADANGIVSVQIIPGVYNVSVAGTVDNELGKYYLNGLAQSIAFTEPITKSEAETNSDLSMNIRPSKVGPLCFSEIYYCGAPGYYFRDQTYQIYNNGDETYYLDHLCLAQLYPQNATAHLPEWPESEGKDNYTYAATMWQIPGNGTDYPLEPGESIIIVQEAADHTKIKSFKGTYGGIDNSMAEWECWSGNASRVNAEVPDLPYVFWAGRVNRIQWLTAVKGSAFALYQPGEALDINDTDYWQDGVNVITPIGKTYGFARLTPDKIIDAVELIPNMSSLDMKRIPGFIDAGATSVGAAYINKSVARKVIDHRDDGTPIYQDTNNSTNDFVIEDIPMIRRNGEKVPSWSPSNE